MVRFLRLVVSVMLTVSVGGGLMWPSFSFAEEQSDSVYFVELADRQALTSIRRELRGYDVVVRSLGRRGPRTYEGRDGIQVSPDVRRWAVVTASVAHTPAVLGVLHQHSAVLTVVRERLYTAATIPSDPHFAEQYGLASSTVPLADINATVAWEKTTGSTATVIAIIDGGVDLDHEDLRDKIWTNGGEIEGNGVDDDGNGYSDDRYGWDFVSSVPSTVSVHHATHVAGIAGASANNGVGVVGVDWGARLMSIRVLNSSGVGREENIIQAIEYAVANGADVINLSIVGPASEALGDAVENAYAAGVVVVAAVGNNGSDTAWSNPMPACADRGGVNMVVGVAATDEAGEPASFSNYGGCVDISAPGKNILSTRVSDRYGEMTGTSMSAPFVAGAAGLYLSLHSGASAAETISALLATRTAFVGEDAEERNDLYKGRLNAAALVGVQVAENTGPTPEPTPVPTPTPPVSNGGSSGGGGDSGGGGGGGGGGGEEQVAEAPVTKKPRVAGAISVHPKANLALLKRVKLTFNFVFGRYPTPAERLYWDTRIKKGEKRTYEALLGAMQWQKKQGFSAGPKSRL